MTIAHPACHRGFNAAKPTTTAAAKGGSLSASLH